ncbi:2'-5' RNA ligase family protein [Segetibacter sp. 3557_3]|uniref:2'-5' RNA ligase family protein n=1 Tax=Segetibacter sp. 3557_3 TaxID=2547429 RepID=UPI0010590494|nr:2'-5' RNA ligase family protein [Segetibacter sp. 3557_3]TDH27400.1 2'-5' RNA ligase family protein [Segetibacter sp. 3557_3]
MSFFVGIVPPPEVADSIKSIQEPFGDNRLEPHITIIPPLEVAEVTLWLKALVASCRQIAPFEVDLTGTGKFGKGVLYMSVAAPSLASVHQRLKQATVPFRLPGKKEEPNTFHPHLTLGRLWCGFTLEGFAIMKELADKFIATGIGPFNINFVRVYEKKAHKRYEKLTDLQLQG